MTFIELLEALEQRLGYQHVPLNPNATTFKQVFECSPVHHEVMHKLVEAIYHANGCRKLTDRVDKESSFLAIGPARSVALKTADVDTYRLLDDFCHALAESFADDDKLSVEKAEKPEAEIIPLDAVRRRR